MAEEKRALRGGLGFKGEIRFWTPLCRGLGVKPPIINKNNTITKQTLPWTYSLGELLKIQYKPIYNFLKILLKIVS